MHQWEQQDHVIQQCCICEKLRVDPIVTKWTPADQREAEYMEEVERQHEERLAAKRAGTSDYLRPDLGL